MRKLVLGVLVTCSLGAAFAGTVGAYAGHAASSPPTLGVANPKAPSSGFGKVKPRVVSYGGDGQSFVAKIRWRSWGGARATGHGLASWVWPGWCSACGSVNLHATVVAFGLSTCGGKRIYKHVEWYFPSRGMSFSPVLSEANLCNWKFSVGGGVYSPRACRAVDLPSSAGSAAGTAEEVRLYAPHAGCTSVRRFLRASGVMRHYGHNARFHHRSWWCGSELSMQLTKLPPQNFTCVRGDFETITFNVRKR